MPSLRTSLRRGTIARQLLILALGTLVPVVLCAALLAVLQAREARATFERGARGQVLAISSAIDAELRASVAALRTLSASQLLLEDDLRGFHGLAARVSRLHSDWSTVVLARPDGTLLLDAALPYGEAPQRVREPASLAELVRRREPVVGSLSRGAAEQGFAFAVRVPVLRQNELVYVLSARVDPAAIARIVREQGMPGDWVASVVDTQLRQVARLHQGQVEVGVGVAPAFEQALTSGAFAGYYRGRTLEGTPSYVAWHRSTFSDWSVGVGIPASSIEAPAWRVLLFGLLGLALSLLLSLALARLLARRIETPVALLAAQARALRQGASASSQNSQASLPSLPDSAAEALPFTSLPPRQEAAPVDTPTVMAQPPAAASTMVELRDLQHALDEAAHAMLALRRARAEAVAANRSKDEFLAMLSHELRNPLSAIANAALLLRLQPTGTAAQSAQGVLQRQIAQLTRLVDDLLDTSRVSRGKVVLDRRPLELSALVRRVATPMVGASRRHRLELRLEPAWVAGDETRLEQIVTNLLSNALRYAPEGGVVELTLNRVGDQVELRVRDEGIGISEELLPHVFDLFVQGERGLERTQGGLGIGLTLARRLAELHDGRLDAASEGEGRGSTFTLCLPLIEAPGGPADVAVPTAASPQHPRLNLLLTDDNDDARRMLRALLEDAGHQVTEAADGLRALELASAPGAPWDAALLDIGLPGLSGLELVQRLRALPRERVPRLLVAVTGYGAPEDHERSRKAGFDLHLVKPVDATALIDQVQALLRERARVRDRGAG